MEAVSDEGNGLVFEKTCPPEAGEIDLNGAFGDGTTYRVTVAVNGTVVWRQPLYDCEGYRLVVRADGTVTQEIHVEV